MGERERQAASAAMARHPGHRKLLTQEDEDEAEDEEEGPLGYFPWRDPRAPFGGSPPQLVRTQRLSKPLSVQVRYLGVA